ncbi:hypothetical protein THAOC_19986 [Thalassiosira oceanica]|uniref:RING-type domain-containing protein n=1 Tax=Thalassiosira oceanica TaxID=159749 RepID=K0SFS4_THAOC|nr:hypothetical protein THAOC_19986 [Thalassiosira oceanica]|eukprot:EJK59756.1 hypothetical protein THAOC_19986 [Thalassiosira oceanica]
MEKTCAFCRTPTPKSDEAILALVQKRVDVGDPMATEFLAQFYYSGINRLRLEMDIPRAIELWTEAARLGNLGAHFWLGFMYFKGEGVEKDETRGIRHWQHAAIQGHPESRHSLGIHEYSNANNKLAVRHLMISAKMGYESHKLIASLRKRPDLDGANRRHVQHGESPALLEDAAVLLLPPPPATLLKPGTAHLPVPHGTQPPEDQSPAPRDGAAACTAQAGEGEAAPASCRLYFTVFKSANLSDDCPLNAETIPLTAASLTDNVASPSLHTTAWRSASALPAADSQGRPVLTTLSGSFPSPPVVSTRIFQEEEVDGEEEEDGTCNEVAFAATTGREKDTHLLKTRSELILVCFRSVHYASKGFWQLSFVFLFGSVHYASSPADSSLFAPDASPCLFVFSEEAMCRGEEKQGAPATLHSPGASTDGPPPIVNDEELMSSGHELHEIYTCPLCCLPIALPVVKHSVVKSCCSKTVCNGCILASYQRGMGDTCAFCRTPTPYRNAAVLALIQKRVEARDPKATRLLAEVYYHGDRGLKIDVPRAIELWTEAANLGDLNAHCMLGIVYYHSLKGVEQDVGRGVQHWQRAAIQGHPQSRHNLAVHEYKNGNHELGVQHWMISAKMGYELSLNKIKDMFMEGHATKAQYAESLKGYQTALDETRSPQREEAKAFFNLN